MAVGAVVAIGMGEVEGTEVEEVRVTEQEGVGEAQGMEVGILTFELGLKRIFRFGKHWGATLPATP